MEDPIVVDDDEHVNDKAESESENAIDDELESDSSNDIADNNDDTVGGCTEKVENPTDIIVVRRSSFSSSSKKPTNIWRKFLMRYRIEICVFLAVFFSVFTTFLQASEMIKAKLQLRRQAPPQRFFSSSSPVVDLYQGNGAAINELLRHGEYVFVMYYAPWCIRCVEARFHFDRLSRTYDGDVRFFAVNCWDPGGRCRYLYKMYTFPVFTLYSTATFQGIYYHGILSADYMYRFLKNTVHPFTRLDEINEAVQFLLASDVSTVLAFYDFSNNTHPLGYETFHWTSLKSLERDPLRDQIRFALITNPRVAQSFNLTHAMIRFYDWSSSFNNYTTYPVDQPYKSVSIIKWMFLLSTDKIQWYYSINDYGKSELLQEIISNPTIILFTPRQPLLTPDPNYLSFVTTAMKYFDCDDSPYVDRTLSVMRRFYSNAVRSYERWKNVCGDGRQLSTAECCRDIVVARTYDSYRNICDVCLPQNNQQQKYDTITNLGKTSVTVQRVCSKFVPDSKTMDFFSGSVISASRTCDELSQYLKSNKLVEYCCDSQPKSREKLHVSSLIAYDETQINEDLSLYCSSRSMATNYCRTMVQRKKFGECNKLRLAKMLNYSNNVFHYNDENSFDIHRSFSGADSMYADPERELRGLSCRTNRTLNFLAFDSDHYLYFAKKLGLIEKFSPFSRKFSTVIIVDRKAESVYRIPSSFKLTTKSFSEFILNFTNGRLRRHLTTEEDSTLNQFVNNNDSVKWTNCDNVGYRVCIDKVSSRNFRHQIWERKQDVVLLFTTSWCGLCQQTYHIFHSLAYYFRSVSPNKLRFAQINADKNDLPWEFTVDSYPTILFLPARNFNDSVAFPRSLPITLPNLISFVLAHCGWGTRLQTAFSLCSGRCVSSSNRRINIQLKKYQRLLNRLRIMAKDKAYLWDWVDEDEDFGPFIPSYLSGIWKDIAETQVKIRTLRLLLRFFSSSRQSLDDFNLKRLSFNHDDLILLLQNNYALLR